ncbi:unnamed protein product [Leuciscus chuanchicus]
MWKRGEGGGNGTEVKRRMRWKRMWNIGEEEREVEMELRWKRMWNRRGEGGGNGTEVKRRMRWKKMWNREDERRVRWKRMWNRGEEENEVEENVEQRGEEENEVEENVEQRGKEEREVEMELRWKIMWNREEERRGRWKWNRSVAYLLCKELASRLRQNIDRTLQRAIDAEKAHWSSVNEKRNLPLKRKNAKLGDPKNGNFLGVLDAIAQYDVPLAEHLRKVKASKYIAVELNCTPDISKQELASVIIRYVHTDDDKNATINKSFVGFTVVKDTTGKGLTETLTGVLDNLGLELANCRGRAMTMAQI